jgi:hypothetical protein
MNNLLITQYKNIKNKTIHAKSLNIAKDSTFGFLFAAIFFLIGLRLQIIEDAYLSYNLYYLISIFFLAITFFKLKILNYFTYFYLAFGVLISEVMNPLILFIIYFLLISPIAFFMRLFGRDSFRLKNKEQRTYWLNRQDNISCESFKDQF